jgi:hypothetical protein
MHPWFNKQQFCTFRFRRKAQFEPQAETEKVLYFQEFLTLFYRRKKRLCIRPTRLRCTQQRHSAARSMRPPML